jgi:hypothetical protein
MLARVLALPSTLRPWSSPRPLAAPASGSHLHSTSTAPSSSPSSSSGGSGSQDDDASGVLPLSVSQVFASLPPVIILSRHAESVNLDEIQAADKVPNHR